ncbi:MAG: T9SS type A sorting domain-containing protein, partial [Bacteroidetes bacterium]|nr:T9SS type A sorting domain-containing protein [Bacteroidota bacterium]
VNSSLPGTFGAPWGPFCIKQCDIKTNDKKDIQVCITAEEGACVDVKIDINYFDPNILYDPANNFIVEIRDPMFLNLVNMGGLGIFPGTSNDVVQVCMPKWGDLGALGMKPGMYYMRIVGTNSNDPENLLGTLIHLTIGVKKLTPPSVYATDTVVCTGNTAFFYVTNVDPASTYEWFFNGSSFYHGPAMGVFFNSPPGTVFDVTVQETYYSCKGPMSPPIKVYATGPPKTILIGDTVSCVGFTAEYCFTGTNTIFKWQTKGATIIAQDESCITVLFTDTISNTAKIILTAYNDCGGFEDTIAVNLTPKISVSVPNQVSMCKGQSATIEATTMGNFFLVWMDAKDNILAKNTNSFTVSPAETTYYTLLISNDLCGKVERKKIIVKVSDTLDAVFKFTVLPNDMLQVTAITKSGTPPYTFNWYNGETTTDNISFDPNETPTIFCTIADYFGCATTLVASYPYITSAETVQNQSATALNWHILPTPQDGWFSLSLNAQNVLNGNIKMKKTIFRVYNMLGQLIVSTSINTTDNQPLLLNLSHLPKGIYLASLYSKDKSITPLSQKFIKQ